MKKRNFYNEDFHLEETTFDSFSKNNKLGSLELPLSRQTFTLVFLFVIFFGVVAILRILFLGFWMGDAYRARADSNVGKGIYEPAPRGIIYDRYGKILADSISSFSVTVDLKELFKAGSTDLILKELSQTLEIPEEEIRGRLKGLNKEKESVFVVAKGVDLEKTIKLKSLSLPGVEAISDYKRNYYDGNMFSSIIGYTGFGNSNNFVGKSGLELYYDDILKGADGETLVFKNAKGETMDKKTIKLAEQGNNLNTTIDYDLQKYFYGSMERNLAALGRTSGVGIAINPQTGEVLSLISFPSFDNNIFSQGGANSERNKLLSSKHSALFNRAVSGLYMPGSTVKPMVSLAALKEGIIDTKKEIFSSGSIEIPNPYNPDKPSVFLDWRSNGWVNLYSAIARSCNIYFYALGGGWEDVKGLGINKLKEYWKKFGFGAKTGIDLPGEEIGSLPDPEEKEKKKNDIWRIGDTYNVSIGQGDLLVTPIQLISQISSIANGGKFYKPHLLKDEEPEVLINFSDLEPYIKEVKIGMRDVVAKYYGTANSLGGLPAPAAGKTGSAQTTGNTKFNAFFVGYMPEDNPKIAILVLIEDAKEGNLNALPVAKDVLGWYYYNRLTNF
ncbi:MAG: penicillin-binding transpeptidase domain-containing protein [Candidatus Pacebacteria bacterium]|nr:penicillin-binding transpeptidase domain-containing protein [Candidatus Paceibacterota bacterium]